MLKPSLTLALALTCCVGFASLVQAKGSYTPRPKPPKTALDYSLAPAQALAKLTAFRQQVRGLVSQGRRPVVVFDVDDTLVRVFGGKQVPGAADYVKGLITDGAMVVYQCGRKESQRAKTEQQLTAAGCPVNARAQLWLKEQKEKAKTVDWKKSQKPKIEALGFPVGFFDNEKNNSRMFRAEFPQSTVFRVNTGAYYPDPGGQGTIWVIDNFKPTP
jgi:hypothetical protein